MKSFEAITPKLLYWMLAPERPPGMGDPCECKVNGAVRICYCKECGPRSTCCTTCFVDRHRFLTNHWAEVWNRNFLERKDISELGHVISYGHDLEGGRCKNAPITDFILVDLNGVHRTKASFCVCIANRLPDKVDQLLSAQVFPGTLKSPAVGFTFRLLEDFHLQTLTSKKSPYDYMMALRRKTNNSFVGDVPVRLYRLTKFVSFILFSF